MAQTSKFSDQDLDRVVAALKIALSAQKVPANLSLVALGTLVSEVIDNNFPQNKQKAIAENFAKALQDSIKD